MSQLLIFPKFPSVGNLNTILNTIINTIFSTFFALGIGPLASDCHCFKIKSSAPFLFPVLRDIAFSPSIPWLMEADEEVDRAFF